MTLTPLSSKVLVLILFLYIVEYVSSFSLRQIYSTYDNRPSSRVVTIPSINPDFFKQVPTRWLDYFKPSHGRQYDVLDVDDDEDDAFESSNTMTERSLKRSIVTTVVLPALIVPAVEWLISLFKSKPKPESKPPVKIVPATIPPSIKIKPIFIKPIGTLPTIRTRRPRLLFIPPFPTYRNPHRY